MTDTKKIPYKIYLEENEMPTQWYNVRADMKNKPAPLLNPQTSFLPIFFARWSYFYLHFLLLSAWSSELFLKKAQKRAHRWISTCSNAYFTFFNSINWKLFISSFSVLGLAIHHILHETSPSKIPYYQLHLPTTSLLLPHKVIHTELLAYN